MAYEVYLSQFGRVHSVGVVLFFVAIAALLVTKLKISSVAILDSQGKPIKEIKRDIRLLKFIRSLYLSQQGEELAGSEPYLVRSGPYQELVISQPEHVQEFYKHDAKYHEKPKGFNLGELPGRLIGTAVGAQYGDKWQKIRKHFDPPFSYHSTVQSLPRFSAQIEQLVEGFASQPVSMINARESFKFLTFRLLALHLYEDAFDDRIYFRLLELNDSHEKIMRLLLTSKWPDSKLWNKLPIAANRALTTYHKEWKEFNDTLIEHSRGGLWNCPAEVIYRGVDKVHDFTQEDFLSTMDEILFTNVDVSAGVFGTIFTQLAQNISIQDTLREEIKRSKKDPEIGETKYLAKSGSLLSRVIAESMRLSPAFWFSMPETTGSEVKTIGGYSIPPRTPVVIDTRRLNNGTATWGDSATNFNPDRFQDIPSEKLRCGFMKYGTGAASGRCLGKNIADAIFKLTTIAIVESFRLEAFNVDGKVASGQAVDVKLTRL